MSTPRAGRDYPRSVGELLAWFAMDAGTVAVQVCTRHLLPDHHSSPALDAHLGTFRDYLDTRSFVLRNQRHPAAMLGLVRLYPNGVDNASWYAALLRTWLDGNHGTAPRQHAGHDTGTAVNTPAGKRQTAFFGTELSPQSRRAAPRIASRTVSHYCRYRISSYNEKHASRKPLHQSRATGGSGTPGWPTA